MPNYSDPRYMGKRTGGNYTKGPKRRGYRGGRKRVYPEGTPTMLQSIKLSSDHRGIAYYLGKGNVMAGVRLALDILSEFLPANAKDTYFMGENVRNPLRRDPIRRRVSEMKAEIHRTAIGAWSERAHSDDDSIVDTEWLEDST